ncbi:MAG: UvrD-helicase domain-containing protein [Bacteroidota bacterium]
MPNIKIISAGAGSGKTFRLTEELSALLASEQVKPSGLIATTFTNKAAAELRERVRVKLLKDKHGQAANQLDNALIGTVHRLGVKLLRRFAYEAGVSPQVDIIPDGDQQRMFNLSLAASLNIDFIEEMSLLCERLGLGVAGEPYNWRKEVLRLVDMIRSNDLNEEAILESSEKSWYTLSELLPEVIDNPDYFARLRDSLGVTSAALEQNEADSTRKTLSMAAKLRKAGQELDRRGFLPWPELAGLTKASVGAKSRDLILELDELINAHATLGEFQDDLRKYIKNLFDCARKAIREFDRYKKSRGLIDYTDMEVLILRLLEKPAVQETLRAELDLLMVDEFQDTSPIQLAIFLKLSALADRSIWVGDPKQSIYGFRGADPVLMRAVIEHLGGLKPENILGNSWRSREDIVYLCNDLFTRAFPDIDERAIALEPMRTRVGNAHNPPESDHQSATAGLWMWAHQVEGGGRAPRQDWYHRMLADSIAELLRDPPQIRPKGESDYRKLQAGDIAILMRRNSEANKMAQALADAGLDAALARTGLLKTAEVTLAMAALRYLLNPEDSLSVAELMRYGEGMLLEDIIEHRLSYLAENKEQDRITGWGRDLSVPGQIDELRDSIRAYSPSEAFNLILELLDLRRVVARWGRGEERLSNLDELRRLSLEYENNCHNRQQAASLGGLLLFMEQLRQDGQDMRAAGKGPDAVNVLTYHKSKGLEWPVVICHELNMKLRADVFGAQLETGDEPFDAHQPLKGRWLRFWPNPYGRLRSGPALLGAIATSDWQQRATERALAEEARLLYVGLTRARDILVLPLANGTGWLDRVYHQSAEANPCLMIDQDVHFSWKGQAVPQHIQSWEAPRSLPVAEPTLKPIRFLKDKPGGPVDWPDRYLPEEKMMEAYPGGSLDPVLAVTYAHTPTLLPEYEGRSWSDAVRAFVLADWSGQYNGQDRLDLAERVWQQTLPLQDFQPLELFEQSDGLRHYLNTLAGEDCHWHSRVNFHGPAGDHLIAGQLDWVGRTEAGIYVLQGAEIFGQKWAGKLNKQAAAMYWRAKSYAHFAQVTLLANLAWLPAQGLILPLSLEAPVQDLLAQTQGA